MNRSTLCLLIALTSATTLNGVSTERNMTKGLVFSILSSACVGRFAALYFDADPVCVGMIFGTGVCPLIISIKRYLAKCWSEESYHRPLHPHSGPQWQQNRYY